MTRLRIPAPTGYCRVRRIEAELWQSKELINSMERYASGGQPSRYGPSPASPAWPECMEHSVLLCELQAANAGAFHVSTNLETGAQPAMSAVATVPVTAQYWRFRSFISCLLVHTEKSLDPHQSRQTPGSSFPVRCVSQGLWVTVADPPPEV